MLELKNIRKTYITGDTKQDALKDVSICFRKSEFVSILGQSGSGKTTLLNIIGGLDQYTEGDLIINGVSTKKYKDRDWDNYRNHSIGFVFQSYNLIPHQTVLANVELALTLSGISKAERRKRAEEVLTLVGLADQMHKRPNQMSGGQMQRVAIARALINNPDILLADEPTGALDSETSVQVMELLKNVSKDRLVIMVTHNPDLAEQYSNRIVRLLDGNIVNDSRPYLSEELAKDFEEEKKAEKENTSDVKKHKNNNKNNKKKKKTSMSFFTALSLSFNNLLTKKGRTILTSFAGSIGIIGIALILSVSTGFQLYIDRVQEDTLSSYPITIYAESVDLSSLISSFTSTSKDSDLDHDRDAVYENQMFYELMNSMNSAEVTTNNLKKFKEFLESDEEIKKHLASVQYEYGLDFNIYTEDVDGKIIKSDVMELFKSDSTSESSSSGIADSTMSTMLSSSSYQIWQEMLSGTDGSIISDTLKEQYEIIGDGRWPEAANEIVLVVDKNNEVSDLALFALGLKTKTELIESLMASQSGEIVDTTTESWSYDEIYNLEFKLILNTEKYVKKDDGTYTDISQTDTGLDYLYSNEDVGITLKVVGIIRQSEDAVTGMMSGSIGYTSALTDYAIDKIVNSDIVQAQLEDRTVNVITGLPFKTDDAEELTDEEKINSAKEKLASMTADEKAAIYKSIMSTPSDEYVNDTVKMQLSMVDRTTIEQLMVTGYAEQMGLSDTSAIEEYIKALDDETLYAYAEEALKETVIQAYKDQVELELSKYTSSQLAQMFDATEFSDEEYVNIYDEFLPATYSEQTFSEVIFDSLGYVSKDYPSTIYLYATTFEEKDAVADCIARYNDSVDDEDNISYTDYVKLLMSSITTIINAITIVLTGFVAISLVVSSIMIGIITYISVLERTKEIGILRAVGASKKDVSRVFNAETLIVGFAAGIMGIIVSLLILIPINIILLVLTGLSSLKAVLPIGGAVILVLISMFLTFIAGLVPSRFAAKKNPVEALRTE